MARRFATTLPLTMTLAALLAMPVAAKELAVAVRLETAIPPDLQPGDTIDLAFGMTVTTPDGEGPYDADPISVRVSGRSGAPVDVLAVRDGPGHYVATITVPPSDIGRIAAILPSDGPEPLAWELYAAPPIIGTAPGPGTAPTAATPATPAIADGLAPVIALGLAAAVAAAAGAVAVGRRRKVLPAAGART